MKARDSVIGILVLSTALIAGEKKSTHEEISQVLKQEFRFAPLPANEQPKEEEKAPPVILERLTVVESVGRRQLEQSIRAEKEKVTKEKFTLKSGGRLFGNERVQIGLWPEGKGLYFLKVRW